MPTKQEAKNLDRVQGIDSSLNDLTLHDGKVLHLELGARVAPGPKLKRAIDGGSAVELTILDHELEFLEASLLGEKFDCELDEMHFRWMGADLRTDGIGLTLKDRDIAILEEQTEPLSAFRKDMTRARFIVNAIKKVRPTATITCPEIDVVQPVETEKQGKKAKADAKANKGKGLGEHTKGLKIKGEAAKPSEIEIGHRAMAAASSQKAPFRVAVAMMAALIVESGLGRYAHNYMQMTGETAGNSKFNPNVIEEACTGFLRGYLTGETGAIEYFQSHPSAEPFEIAQAVQKSGAGLASNGQANYGPVVAEAREWVEAFEGGEFSAEGASRTVTEPYKYELCVEHEGEKEDANWWEGIKRLAKEVNWRAFWVSGRFFYIDEIELFKQQVRLHIQRGETPGIQSVIGPWRANRKGTELTVTAFASHWPVPPGGVVTVGGYGPFSVGFGQAPLEKGQVGISGNRKAATGEGRARYLLETLEIPLRDSDTSGLKLVTAKLRKPTAPLPEPAATKKTVTKGGGASAGGGGPKVEKVLAFCEREAKKNPPYVWGGFSPAGYDCSGAVSAALNEGGWLNGRLDTQGLAAWGEAGKGENVTVYVKTTGGAHEEHTIIEVDGRFFESGGGGNESSSGGFTEFHPSPEYLAEFDTKRHPKGF